MQASFIIICLRADEVRKRVAGVERDGGGRKQGETEFHFRFCWVVLVVPLSAALGRNISNGRSKCNINLLTIY